MAVLFLALLPLEASVTFLPVKAEGVPEEEDVLSVHWLDYDNDGKPDLYLNSRLYHNISEKGAFRFEDKTEASGINGQGPFLCYDYDNDGWCDIIIAGKEPHVWRNKGNGTFEDTAAALGFKPTPPVVALCAGDVDGDGSPDLFLGKGEERGERVNDFTYYPAELWLNQGSKWLECASLKGVDRKTYARTVLMGDLNSDGCADIFVGNYRLQPNLLWISDGQGGFTEMGVSAGIAGKNEPKKFYDKTLLRNFGPSCGHTIAACWLDYDNDGRLDIFTANLAHKYVGKNPRGKKGYDIRGYICGDSEVLHNLGNRRFADAREQLKIPVMPIGDIKSFKGDELWGGCAPADVDNDGWEDVFVPQIYNLPYASALLMMNQEGRGYLNRAVVAGIVRYDTHSGAWADVDGDGWMDILVGGRPDPGQMPQKCFYRNTTASGNWLKVILRSGSAGTALGAVVSLKTDVGAPQMRINSSNVSTCSQQNDPALHFGIGLAVKAEVTVRWPDGTSVTAEGDANATLTFVRDKPPVKENPAVE